ncbi:MAG: ERF family protein [Pseudomonadota bacterium]
MADGLSYTEAPRANILEFSTAVNALAPALADAQTEIEAAVKGGLNPHLKSQYAELADVIEACQPALNKYGFSILQGAAGLCLDGHVRTETMLLHKTGQWVRVTTTLKPKKDDEQAIGAATSYARRYGLSALCNVRQADTDAQQESRLPKAKARELFDALNRQMRECQSYEELRVWGGSAGAKVRTLPEDWESEIRGEYEKLADELRGVHA